MRVMAKHPRRLSARRIPRLVRLPLRLRYTNFASLLALVVIPTIYFYNKLTNLQVCGTRHCGSDTVLLHHVARV